MSIVNSIFYKSIMYIIGGGLGILLQSCTPSSSKYVQVPFSVCVESVIAQSPFVINEQTMIIYPANKKDLLEGSLIPFSKIERHTGFVFEKVSNKRRLNNCILLKHDSLLPSEGYRLKINKDSIVMEVKDASGAFYASQWLEHSLLLQEKAPFELATIKVKDHPVMNYRGVMLDVSRHFFTVEQVKRFIDLLAMHRLNFFHWHLTDDQGWRIEIKKYPELTKIGAWRGNGSTRTGGFYTQNEIKEVVAYAKERAITIVPEIDFPGHTTAALAAYPQLGCTGGPYEVAMESGGVHKDVICMGKDFSWQFAKDVLAEVADLFPSPYIHIGGDEVPRDRWKTCPFCQKVISEFGLKDTQRYSAEDLLQGEFNERMAVYLKKIGKKMIGWDEVLSDNIDPETVIMSWRGLGRGVTALMQGHPVVFSSNGHFYLNNYQSSDMENEPKATGGLVPMSKLYAAVLTTPEMKKKEQDRILGAEACLWTSYISDNQILDYMTLPRLAAFSEIVWSDGGKRNYIDFLERLPVMLELYAKTGYHYASHFFEIEGMFRPDMKEKRLEVTLKSMEGTDVFYTLDGAEPTLKSKKYVAPFYVSENTLLQAVAYTPSGIRSDILRKKIKINKATFTNIQLLTQPSKRYLGNKGTVLVDGVRSDAFHTTGLWVGYQQHPLEVLIDLAKKQKVKQVGLSSLTDMSAYIMGIERIQIAVSVDGEHFQQVAERILRAPEVSMEGKRKDWWNIGFDEIEARYIKVLACGFGTLPIGHSGAGEIPFLFVDEIEVY